MQSRPQQPISRQSVGKKRGLDIHQLSSGKKTIEYTQLKMPTNPSPARMIQFTNDQNHTFVQSTPDNKGGSALKESRVLIRQNELVEFTKKFAVEKADYEDRIEELQREYQGLKSSNMKLDEEFRTLLVAYKHKEHRQFQFVTEVQSLREEAARLSRELKERCEQSEAMLSRAQSDNHHLRSELDQVRDRYFRANEDIKRLETAERENARTLGERVFDIVKLSNELQATKRQTKEHEADKIKFQSVNSEYVSIRYESQQLKREIMELNADNEQSQQKIMMLLEEIARLNSQGQRIILTSDNQIIDSEQFNLEKDQEMVELKRKVVFLEQQNEKFRERLEQQSIHKGEEVVYENKALVIELNDRNKKIFDLSSQVGTLRRRIKSFSQESSPVQSRVDSQALIVKCCELENHVQSLNKKIIDLEQTSKTKEIHNFQDIAFSQINTQTRLLKPSNEGSSVSLQPSSSCASNIDQLYSQNQMMKMELDKLNQISAEHRALQGSIRNMEGLLETLRKENTQLKGGSERKRVLIKRNNEGDIGKADEDRIRQLEREKTVLKEENDFLRMECGVMQKQMIELREQLTNLKTSKFQRTLNTSSLTEGKQDRLSYLLRKIAEYSRQIVADKDNPLQFQLYSTIFTKFMRHIEVLESHHGSPQEPKVYASPRPISQQDPF